MINNDAERHDDVAQCHEGHDDLREMCDSFYAAKDYEAQHRDNGNGGDEFGYRNRIAEEINGRFPAKCQLRRVADAV